MPPTTALETELTALFSRILGDIMISIDDNMFALGCNSMQVIWLLASIQETFGVEVPLESAYLQPTVAHLASMIMEARKSDQNIS